MTTEEIKNLIDQKIAGQGSMVDVGGALPVILKEIVDKIAQASNPIVEVSYDGSTDEISLARE